MEATLTNASMTANNQPAAFIGPQVSPWQRHAHKPADWVSTSEEREAALQTITELAARVSVFRDKKYYVPITTPELLDFAHFTVKLGADGMGAIIVVTVPVKATLELTGQRELASAYMFVGVADPFADLILHHSESITDAIRAAKPIVQARAN